MESFSSDGVEIAFIDEGAAGSRGTPVLLIHGFASNVATNWTATGWVGDLTAKGYRVIGFDNRGHGKSEKLYELAQYGAPLMAEDARRLLDHLSIPKAHVIGYSMGARIAAFLALNHPERVASLVFGGLGINMVRGMAGTGPIAHALEAASIDEACIRSARDPITAEALGGLSCPVLVAVGETDVVGGSGPDLARLIPGAQAFVIQGRDHMKAVGDRTFKEAIFAFLEAQG